MGRRRSKAVSDEGCILSKDEREELLSRKSVLPESVRLKQSMASSAKVYMFNEKKNLKDMATLCGVSESELQLMLSEPESYSDEKMAEALMWVYKL